LLSANGATWTLNSPIQATVTAPTDTTVIIEDPVAFTLTFNFYQTAVTPLPASPWKRIVITKLTAGFPSGCGKGWSFDVSYPTGGGLSNSTACYISNAGASTARTIVLNGGHEETWTSSVSGVDPNPIRTADYQEKIAGVLVKHTIDIWKLSGRAGSVERLASSTVVLDGGTSGLTTTYDYWNSPGDINHGRLLKVTRSDGSWSLNAIKNDNIAHTTTTLTVTPYGSTPPPSLASVVDFDGVRTIGEDTVALCTADTTITSDNVISYTYGTLPVGFVLSREKKAGNITVQKRQFANDFYEDLNTATAAADQKVISSVGDWIGSGTSAEMVSLTGRNGLAPGPSNFTNRTKITYIHDHTNNLITAETQTQEDSASAEQFKTITVSRRHDGRPERQEKRLTDGVNTDVPFEVKKFSYDPYDRNTAITINGVMHESRAYPTLFVHPQAVTAMEYTDSEGIHTTTEYDAYGRTVRQTLHGSSSATVFSTVLPAQVDLVSTWVYSPRATGIPGYISVRTDTAGTGTRITTEEYDGAGRLVWQEKPDSSQRYYTYGWNGLGGRLDETKTGSPATPGILLSSRSYHRDGSPSALSGDAELPQSWEYAVPAAYRERTTRKLSGSLAEETTKDGFGRVVSITTPVSVDSSGSPVYFTSGSGWDANGKQVWRSRPGPSGTFYEVWSHNPASGEVISGFSADDSLSVSTDTSLRSTITTNLIDTSIASLTVDGTAVRVAWRTVSQKMPTATGSAWETTAATIRKSALSERPVSSWLGHTSNSLPREYVNEGGTIYTEAVNKSWTGTTLLSSQRRVLRNSGQYRKIVSHNGLDYAFTSPEAANVLLPYSAFREPLAEMSWDTIPHWPKLEINPSTGLISARLLPNSALFTAKYTYFTGGQDHRTGRIASMQSWTYQPSSAAKGTTYYHYNARGQVLATYGDGTTPSANIYDSTGRKIQLRTWRTVPSLNPATIDGDLTAAAATAQITTWAYAAHPAVTLVRSKTYPGRPTAVEYAYWPDGSLLNRKWERTDGADRLLTSYHYTLFGQLDETKYGSTATPSFASTHPNYAPTVSLDYDRAGRLWHRTDGAGRLLLTYRYDGSPLTEYTVNASDVPLAAGRQLKRTLDSFGRLSSLESSWGSVMGGGGGWDTVSPIVSYTYNTADRLSGVSSGGAQGDITRTAAQDSFSVALIGVVSGKVVYSSIVKDSYGRPSSHTAAWSDYTTNYALFTTPFTWDANRLQRRGETDMDWNYVYDSKGQVATTSKTFTGGAVVVAGSQNAYTYDGIGNRLTLGEGGTSTPGSGLRVTTYTPNDFNQYTTIDRPQSFDVSGKRSSSSAVVTVNGTALPLGGSDYQPGSSGLYFR
jgi:YD repeat-containing protein